MSFSKTDLDLIKSKILISNELEKKVKIIKKGKDKWCCCPFHNEKTPSCKINDDMGSFYCFGCGAKGDIFTIYTDLYNFSFPDAVKELAQKAGVNIKEKAFKSSTKNDKINKILELSLSWFEKNLLNDSNSQNYLAKRFINNDTIKKFRIGYSYSFNGTLVNFLKDAGYTDKEILESNTVKLDKNNKMKDFFYKRLIFPIFNEYGKIIGFGGRVLDDSNPKYINSPESDFFKKREILYNMHNAKQEIRNKKNMLICEGYMDVISLYQNGIKTGVAPLGTALTETQLLLSWKYVNKPTIMFDGDSSGIRASYKTALMALQLISPQKYLQFILLPQGNDPDSYIQKNSFTDFVKVLKSPITLVDFIFEQSSSTIDLSKPDNKISFDKYLEDIIETIKDKKIKFFYKNEFKSLFFSKIKNRNKEKVKLNVSNNSTKIRQKQLLSFIATYLHQIELREELYEAIINSQLMENTHLKLLEIINKQENRKLKVTDIVNLDLDYDISSILRKSIESSIFQLFPYSHPDCEHNDAKKQMLESIKNLNTRLSNLKKINKSLNKFENSSTPISWEELKNLTKDLQTYGESLD